MAEKVRTVYQGSTEDYSVDVSALVSLSAQTVVISFDGGSTWKTAAWVGSAGKERTATYTITGASGITFPSDCIPLVKIDSTIKPVLDQRVLFRTIPVV